MPGQKLISTGDSARDKAERRAAIIGQVDYWFSDEGLTGSQGTWLRDDLIGHKYGKNDEISITKLDWRPTMKNCFQDNCGMKSTNMEGRAEIMEALKDSTMVNVVTYRTVQRKVPFTMKIDSHNGSDGDEGDDGAWNEENKKKLFAPDTRKLMKKMSNATGFEERFADAPITPAEHEENKDCYHIDRAPHDRIEVAIQRYKARRKFHTQHLQVFNAWLKFGGVETGERRFGGPTDKAELAGMSAFDKAIELATHHVGEEKGDENKWVIDFEGVAKAYLSSSFPQQFFDPEPEKIQLQCTGMKNFYNYLLHHEVCPEYTDEIYAARAVTAKAEIELTKIHNLGPKLPGQFTVACSVLLGGNLRQSHGDGSIIWDDISKDITGMSPSKAGIVLATAVTSLGSEGLSNVVLPENLSGVAVDMLDMAELHNLGLEVVAIQHPTEDTIKIYDTIDEENANKGLGLKPLGKLICKPWAIPTFVGQDLPRHLRNETFANAPDTYNFWLEDEILQELLVGMKMSAEVRRLVGQKFEESVWILDGVNTIFCSFYSLILNDLMPHPHKEVRMLTVEEQAAAAADGDDGGDLSD